MAQANAVLTRFNSAVMAQTVQLSVTMNAMKAQLRILSSAPTNQTRSNMKYYCWSCGINYTHGSITCSAKKEGHQEDAYHKKGLIIREKGYK